jgi:hypothetical protein
MSSILKALRKIEEEKRAAEHAAPDLRIDQGLVHGRATRLLPLFSGVVLGATLVGLFFLWSTKELTPSNQNNSAPMPNLVLSGHMQAAKTANVGQGTEASVPVTTGNNLEPIILATKSLEPFHEAGKISVVILPKEPVATVESTVKASKAIAEKVPVQKEQPVLSSSIPASAAPLLLDASVLPKGLILQVTEIFYQDDSANSMAVVNDLPVMVGTQVESAVVSEIQPDRVIFKVGDKTYSIAGVKP